MEEDLPPDYKTLSLILSTAQRKEKMLHCVPESRGNKESACVILLSLLFYYPLSQTVSFSGQKGLMISPKIQMVLKVT